MVKESSRRDLVERLHRVVMETAGLDQIAGRLTTEDGRKVVVILGCPFFLIVDNVVVLGRLGRLFNDRWSDDVAVLDSEQRFAEEASLASGTDGRSRDRAGGNGSARGRDSRSKIACEEAKTPSTAIWIVAGRIGGRLAKIGGISLAKTGLRTNLVKVYL